MGITKKAFIKYIDSAYALADNVKRNITKDGIIDNKTILALNDFIISANAVKDLHEELKNGVLPDGTSTH